MRFKVGDYVRMTHNVNFKLSESYLFSLKKGDVVSIVRIMDDKVLIKSGDTNVCVDSYLFDWTGELLK